ncbi:MAG: TonB-dependent receptor [Cocleimonas sp.]|nr:TonB-dependent receptor [Cocleimonas sp.]
MKNKLFATSVAATAITPVILFFSFLTTQHTFADTVKVDDDGGLQLSITANRRAQSIDKTLASVTVITRKDIENTRTQDIVDLLRQQRGISIARTGGVGSQTSVFIRGTESDHVLVLLDGVRIASATTGFDWSQIPLDQVERIEIVRGPRAALYGSDAIGGVIEITTRKNTRPYLSMTAGKYGTRKVSAGFSDGDEKSRVSLNVSSEKSDGFSATNPDAGQYSYDPDKDAHRKGSLSLSFSRQLTNKTKAGIELFQSNNDIDFDIGSSDVELATVNTYVESNVTDKWSHKLNVSYAKNEVLSTSIFSEFTTGRRELNWQNNIALANSVSLILGANYREESGKTGSISTEEINNKAVYANVNKKKGALNLDLTVRHDKHSQAGNRTTGQVASGYDLSTKTTAYASYGTAFRAPNINDLYYPGFFGSYAGNPNLKPETSKTFEVGLKSRITDNQYLEGSLFHTKISNLISNSGANSQAINIDKATLKGLELGYSGKSNKLSWGADLTLLRTKNDVTKKRLLRRPNHKVTLNLGYDVSEKTRLGMDASFVGSREDFGAKLDDYSLLNLSLNQKLTKRASLGLRLENVTNEDYELAYGYNTPKRGAYLTFSYK